MTRLHFFRLVIGALIAGVFLLSLGAWAWVPTQSADEVDVTFATVGEVELALDVYLPETTAPVPAVILIHGGYWQTGDKQSHARLASRVMQWGYAAFAVNYRLAPDFPFPAAVEDVQCAIVWVRKHASKYGIDPNRIALLGTSAAS